MSTACEHPQGEDWELVSRAHGRGVKNLIFLWAS